MIGEFFATNFVMLARCLWILNLFKRAPLLKSVLSSSVLNIVSHGSLRDLSLRPRSGCPTNIKSSFSNRMGSVTGSSPSSSRLIAWRCIRSLGMLTLRFWFDFFKQAFSTYNLAKNIIYGLAQIFSIISFGEKLIFVSIIFEKWLNLTCTK